MVLSAERVSLYCTIVSSEKSSCRVVLDGADNCSRRAVQSVVTRLVCGVPPCEVCGQLEPSDRRGRPSCFQLGVSRACMRALSDVRVSYARGRALAAV